MNYKIENKSSKKLVVVNLDNTKVNELEIFIENFSLEEINVVEINDKTIFLKDLVEQGLNNLELDLVEEELLFIDECINTKIYNN